MVAQWSDSATTHSYKSPWNLNLSLAAAEKEARHIPLHFLFYKLVKSWHGPSLFLLRVGRGTRQNSRGTTRKTRTPRKTTMKWTGRMEQISCREEENEERQDIMKLTKQKKTPPVSTNKAIWLVCSSFAFSFSFAHPYSFFPLFDQSRGYQC